MMTLEQPDDVRVIPGLTCACGCGQFVNFGKTWVQGHHARVNPPKKPTIGPNRPPRRLNTGRCPRCGQVAPVRQDGQMGRHFDSARRDRQRCLEGELNRRPTPPGQRVQVTVDVVIPADMTRREFELWAGALLREHAHEAFIVRVQAEEVPGE